MIEVKNIRKSFGDKEVLKGVSANMLPGKTNLIIGASGSGKTVFIKCMIGLIRPDEGEVLYEGKSLLDMDKYSLKELRQQVGMLFQGGALFDSQTVAQNVRFPLDMLTKKSKGEKIDRVDEVLKRVNLEGVNDKYPSEISGGMQKRVALARAIVMNPKYLFCDEPNSGLDPQTSIVIDELIRDITQEFNITTVINTHDMNSVMGSGDNIIYLHKGLKKWEGSSRDIVFSDDKELNNFIFASDFLRKAKEASRREADNTK
ncbi:MAG: ATP-binding cassette domain-containing protein [Chitinophagaceae bacterium]|nr:ATP-binding cassette domain-containing protein [Chitinophagaceae bacterium]MCB9045896.1 ATP-binding cassette domain-containing protein [Chitinophagales bacterium]